jgi:hypothetical protein
MLLQRLTCFAGALALAGCAALNTVVTDVSTHGQWPAQRAPGSYQFERLPSQQAQPEQQAALETAARGALDKAGFKLAPDGARPDVTVQLGARVTRNPRSPWDDPYWGGGWGWGPRGWRGAGFFPPYMDSSPSYEREVALLIRDRASGAPLYEARAVSDGNGTGDVALLAAMYDAALQDFPTPALNPRRVRVPLAP